MPLAAVDVTASTTAADCASCLWPIRIIDVVLETSGVAGSVPGPCSLAHPCSHAVSVSFLSWSNSVQLGGDTWSLTCHRGRINVWLESFVTLCVWWRWVVCCWSSFIMRYWVWLALSASGHVLRLYCPISCRQVNKPIRPIDWSWCHVMRPAPYYGLPRYCSTLTHLDALHATSYIVGGPHTSRLKTCLILQPDITLMRIKMSFWCFDL